MGEGCIPLNLNAINFDAGAEIAVNAGAAIEITAGATVAVTGALITLNG